MNKREAKILALEVFAENANLLIESEREYLMQSNRLKIVI